MTEVVGRSGGVSAVPVLPALATHLPLGKASQIVLPVRAAWSGGEGPLQAAHEDASHMRWGYDERWRARGAISSAGVAKCTHAPANVRPVVGLACPKPSERARE
jgi:hypothetical protein